MHTRGRLMADTAAIEEMLAKQQIRELAWLYARGVDRKDAGLLRSLYAANATESRPGTYEGTAEGFISFLEQSFPSMPFTAHHVCNHLVAVDGDVAQGEVSGTAWHIVADGKGGWLEIIGQPRYFDRYVRQDGRWLFARRATDYSRREIRPATTPPSASHLADPARDRSYEELTAPYFARHG